LTYSGRTSGPDPDKPWEFQNLRRFISRIREHEGEDAGAVVEIGMALAKILENPYEPPGLVHYPFQGHSRNSRLTGERRIAELPHGWHLTYVIAEWEELLPIVYHRMIVVSSLDKRSDI